MIQFKDLPVEIQQRMLDEQERQGNTRNAKEFEEGIMRGFSWDRSVEGFDFWNRIIENGDLAEFYKKYPKQKL
jgi:hypothetical protein